MSFKMRGKSAEPLLNLNPQCWCMELSRYWEPRGYEKSAVIEWIEGVLELLHAEAEASFVDKEPTDRALRARLKVLLIRWIQGPRATAFLQGRTAELQAKRANKEPRWKPSAEDYAEFAGKVFQGAKGSDDSEESGGSGLQ